MIRVLACRLVLFLCVATGVVLPVATSAGASTLTARESRPYQLAGKAVEGTPTPAGAPRLKPGQYTDSLGADEQRNYTVDLVDGVTPYITATVIRPLGVVREPAGDYATFTDYVEIGILTASGSSCGTVQSSRSQDRSVTPVTSVARPGRVGNDWSGAFSGRSDANCGKPGRYVVSVTRTQSSAVIPETDLPVEIVFIAEPPLANDATTLPPKQPVSTSSLAPDITAAAESVEGGGSFNKATALPESGGYTDSIKPGETLYYRVRLGQGQRLGYTVRFTGQKSLDDFIPVLAYIATPYRGVVEDSDDTASYSSSSDEKIAGQMAAPVGYRNRESDDDPVEQLLLGGYYYLVVNMANSDKPTQVDVPINIAVRVAGQESDAPKYRKVDGTSDLNNLGLPGQESSGWTLRKVAFLAGGGVALTLAVVVLLPVLRRRTR